MKSRYTKKTQELVNEQNRALTRGWKAANGRTVRYTYERVTEDKYKIYYPFDRYQESYSVSVIMAEGDRSGTVLLTHDRAPWVQMQTTEVPIYKALEVLRSHGDDIKESTN